MKKIKTILYVDDCLEQLSLMKDNLNDYNVNCLTAKDGLKGFDVYLNHKDKIDLVITDINMPFWTGWDLMQHIRLFEKCEGIKNKKRIVSISGDYNSKDYYIKLGFDNHLEKPTRIEQILYEVYKK